MFGLFFPASKKASVYVVDTVRTNQMPNMTNLFNAEHAAKLVVTELCVKFLCAAGCYVCVYEILSCYQFGD